MPAVPRVGENRFAPALGRESLTNLTDPLDRKLMLDIGRRDTSRATGIGVDQEPAAREHIDIARERITLTNVSDAVCSTRQQRGVNRVRDDVDALGGSLDSIERFNQRFNIVEV